MRSIILALFLNIDIYSLAYAQSLDVLNPINPIPQYMLEKQKSEYYWENFWANLGNSDSQYNLAQKYSTYSEDKDEAAAAAWYYLQAAENGNVNSQYSIGVSLQEGRGIIKNDVEAAKWLEKAAQQNHDTAQYRLGEAYFYGRGVSQDTEKARYWVELSIKNGAGDIATNLLAEIDNRGSFELPGDDPISSIIENLVNSAPAEGTEAYKKNQEAIAQSDEEMEKINRERQQIMDCQYYDSMGTNGDWGAAMAGC